MRRTQIGEYCFFKTAFSEEGRAWAAIPTARADGPGFGALGRTEARQRPPAERPPEAGAVATSLAHQRRALSYAAPLPKSAYNRRSLFPNAAHPLCCILLQGTRILS
mgnify:CR=1 FL=1